MFIYLASPYYHPDPDVRQARYEAACEMAALLTLAVALAMAMTKTALMAMALAMAVAMAMTKFCFGDFFPIPGGRSNEYRAC